MKRLTNRLLLVAAVAILYPAAAFAGLKEYVAKPDDTYRYEIVESLPLGPATVHKVKLHSQTWQGIEWQHWLSVFVPETLEHKDKALIFIGGGDNTEEQPRLGGAEARILAQIASGSKSIVAMLQQVPNQPLFDGMTEDEIISFTYEKYLNNEGDDWPLLFPMVKSAVRAMDTVTAIGKEKLEAPVAEFMLTGGSKRGWTTWLSAVADPRVKRIAPLIIDMLNGPKQMPHQFASYGGFSEQIADYTERGIQARMGEERGKLLSAQVDPYFWREELTLPKLIVLGTNDPY